MYRSCLVRCFEQFLFANDYPHQRLVSNPLVLFFHSGYSHEQLKTDYQPSFVPIVFVVHNFRDGFHMHSSKQAPEN